MVADQAAGKEDVLLHPLFGRDDTGGSNALEHCRIASTDVAGDSADPQVIGGAGGG